MSVASLIYLLREIVTAHGQIIWFVGIIVLDVYAFLTGLVDIEHSDLQLGGGRKIKQVMERLHEFWGA